MIVDLVETIVPPSDFRQLRDGLPEHPDDENWRKLFELVDAGGWGDAQEAQTGGGPQPESDVQSAQIGGETEATVDTDDGSGDEGSGDEREE